VLVLNVFVNDLPLCDCTGMVVVHFAQISVRSVYGYIYVSLNDRAVQQDVAQVVVRPDRQSLWGPLVLCNDVWFK
jgi:hypothetical protein